VQNAGTYSFFCGMREAQRDLLLFQSLDDIVAA
jgi:hypothetical protein